MYDGDPVEDEVKQNALDQMFPLPPTKPTEVIPIKYEKPIVESTLGLTNRQRKLINNEDDLPQTGAARERRLQIIHRDIDAINKFLPRLEEVRTYLLTMPVNDDEDLTEAARLSDMKLKHFISEVTAKLNSLEQELELKKATV